MLRELPKGRQPSQADFRELPKGCFGVQDMSSGMSERVFCRAGHTFGDSRKVVLDSQTYLRESPKVLLSFPNKGLRVCG